MSRVGWVMTVALLLVACDSGPPPVRLTWDPGAGALGAFPDDAFTGDDPAARTGLRLDVTPQRIPEVAKLPANFQDIFHELGTLDGFGLVAGTYVRFDGALDETSLASGENTATATAPILLGILSDGGPAFWPYEVKVTDEGRTVIVNPMRPLPPRSTGFLAVTNRVRGKDGRPVAASAAMSAALKGRAADAVTERVAPRMAAAAAALVAAGAVERVEDLAGVVVFTTQSAFEDAVAIAADAAAADVRPEPGTTCVTETLWVRCEGHFVAVDYRGADGVIEDIGVGDHAEPDRSATYVLPFTAWLPLERPGPFGGDAFPTLVFGHGLGGERQQAERLAEYAAPRGLATVAIDAVEHGEHPTAQARTTLQRVLRFFGIDEQDLTFLPLLMRDHFRQSTYDKLQLVRLLRLGVDLDGDGTVDLDPARLAYVGVSLGGIMGPELLALAPELGAAVLAIAGGRVGSIVEDAGQFAIVITLMKPADSTDGDVARFFPVLQTILDRGDAAVWATHLLDEPGGRPAGLPAAAPHVIGGMVLNDNTVPNTCNRALWRAMGLPVVPPVRAGEVGLVGLTGTAPVSANLPDGRTAALVQFDLIPDGQGGMEPATHDNVSDSAVGIEAWFRFLDAYFTTGVPVIVDPYAELGL
ncbi:MAG: hypothetical protein HY906_00220 [Deltaproteobacteria bacterium]|nr:hypothetical protein [Deltaproteobacteria bacterium]